MAKDKRSKYECKECGAKIPASKADYTDYCASHR